MKLSPEEIRSLSKQISQLLETEEWVFSIADRDGELIHAHVIAGLCNPPLVGLLVNCLYKNKSALIEQAKQNFP